MDSFILARVIHVLSVVIWIGGVAMVTLVILPAVQSMRRKEDKIETFEKIEGRFSLYARITTVLTGLSGFYMLEVIDGWSRYLHALFWWIHAMTIIWLIFTVVLFVLEPFVLKRLFHKYTQENPDKTFKIIYRAHIVLLILSLITTAGAVAGSHGWYF